MRYLTDVLVSELARVEEPLVVVLEDYHAVASEDVHRLLERLVPVLSPALHVVVLTRRDPPWPLGHWRAQGWLLELRGRDLRFTPDEARSFFAAGRAVSLADSTVETLVGRAEGWIAGLRLMKLSLREAKDPEERARALSGTDRLIVDYLATEVLSAQPLEVRDFLAVTAPLSRFCASLAEHLLGEGSPRPRAHETLARLELDNMFLVPLDNEGRWYRYHHLFRDLLLHHLPELPLRGPRADVHRRAGEWFGREGLLEEALRNLIEAGELDAAAHLVGEHVRSAIDADQSRRVLSRWLALFPPGAERGRLALLVAHGYVKTVTWDFPGLAGLVAEADALLRASARRRDHERLAPLRAGQGKQFAVKLISVVEWPRMRQALRFTLALVAGLALLTWGASVVVTRTTRAWFERDMQLRAQLAVSGARETLVSHWDAGQETELRKALVELTRDERVLGAAACAADLAPLARTIEYPAPLSCERLGPEVRLDAASPAVAWTTWASVFSVPGGQVHATAIPVVAEDRPLGFVVLVHDLSFVERREATTTRFLVLAFGFLALAASIITVVAARLSWRGWSNELRRLIRGERPPPEFQPFLRDVRELVERLASEREADGLGGLWTPQRLKNTLSRHLHGERVVIVANREPYIHERSSSGEVTLVHPASGLVTALEPVMRACSGVWVAHGSGSGDREASDKHGRLRVPPGEESYVLRRVWLSPEEEKGYYYGFSNEGLWPLCHIAHTRPLFRSEDWRYYQKVNREFAEAVCQEVDTEDPIILVQDYHFALLPRMIREKLPRATVITFWHIPWPNSERFGICPWRDEILAGLLGSSILGFHTQFHCNNFIDSVDRFLESRIDREQNAVVHQGQWTLVRPYPISIEWPSGWLKTVPPVPECRASVLAELGLAPDALLGVGVDRLDYTKGIEERLLAVERLLERSPALQGRFTFVQLAAPSRTIIPNYQKLNEDVTALAARINERFSSGSYRPVILKRAHHEPPTVFRYYRAADVCYVSSLHDGMNLVAKEFVAARDDEQGVLVLSHFTGAARELTEALSVNPYDLEEASAALAAALLMPKEEQRDRMRAMRTFVAEFNVYRWAGRMLVDAARLRRRERLTGRLSQQLPEPLGVAE